MRVHVAVGWFGGIDELVQRECRKIASQPSRPRN